MKEKKRPIKSVEIYSFSTFLILKGQYMGMAFEKQLKDHPTRAIQLSKNDQFIHEIILHH